MALSSKGLRLVAVLVAVLVVLLLIAQFVVGRIYSARYLEGLLEENLNASVKVEEVRVNLFARAVTLRGVSLLPRVPTSRPTAIEIGEVRLGVKALPLFLRRLESTGFVISEPVIHMTLDKEGELSIADLFRQPEEPNGEEEKNQGEEERRVLEAEENRWLAKLDEARLEGGRVEMLFEKERLLLEVEDLAIAVTDLQFDPEDLATLNQVRMTISGAADLFDKEELLLVNLDLEGKASGKLFDEKSGEFDPDVLVDLMLGKDSYLNPRVKIARRIWSYLDQVEKWGVSLGELPNEIGFGRSQRIVGSYRNDRVTLSEPLSLSAGKWEIGLARDSWIATENGQHEIGVEFLAGKKVSQTLGGWLNALPEDARVLARTRFVDEQQVLWRVNSSGQLSDPDFDFLNQLPEAKGLFKELEDSLDEEVDRFKEKADDFLKGLFE